MSFIMDLIHVTGDLNFFFKLELPIISIYGWYGVAYIIILS